MVGDEPETGFYEAWIAFLAVSSAIRKLSQLLTAPLWERPLKTGVLAMGSVGHWVADAAPGLLLTSFITIDEESVLTLHWRRPATRESPRIAAGPTHSCAGHRGAGP